ncbi:MAG: hypothetical protein R3236_11140 [Phycisphaeraceae bacterium]|nr:hypothetical protein [Phycisphaeraceae bacterium]
MVFYDHPAVSLGHLLQVTLKGKVTISVNVALNAKQWRGLSPIFHRNRTDSGQHIRR